MTKYTLMPPVCTMRLLPFPNRAVKIDCLLSSQSLNKRYIRELLSEPLALIRSCFLPSNNWPRRSSTDPLTAQHLAWEGGIPVGKPHTYFLQNFPLFCILHSVQNLVLGFTSCWGPGEDVSSQQGWRRQTGSEDEFGRLPAAFIEKKGSAFILLNSLATGKVESWLNNSGTKSGH